VISRAGNGAIIVGWRSKEGPPRPSATDAQPESVRAMSRSFVFVSLVGVAATVAASGAGLQLLRMKAGLWGGLGIAAACVLAGATAIAATLAIVSGSWAYGKRHVVLPPHAAARFDEVMADERGRLAADADDQQIRESAGRLWDLAVNLRNREAASGD